MTVPPEGPEQTLRFRKKPVVIAAEQFIPERQKPVFYYNGNPLRPYTDTVKVAADVRCDENMSRGGMKGCGRPLSEHALCPTLEGSHIVCPGDWIIRGVKGEFYPCKPDIFAATYDPIIPESVVAVPGSVPSPEPFYYAAPISEDEDEYAVYRGTKSDPGRTFALTDNWEDAEKIAAAMNRVARGEESGSLRDDSASGGIGGPTTNQGTSPAPPPDSATTLPKMTERRLKNIVARLLVDAAMMPAADAIACVGRNERQHPDMPQIELACAACVDRLAQWLAPRILREASLGKPAPPAPSGEPTDEQIDRLAAELRYSNLPENERWPAWLELVAAAKRRVDDGVDSLRRSITWQRKEAARLTAIVRAGEPSVARRTAGDGQTEDREVGAPGISGSSSPVPAPSPEAPPTERCGKRIGTGVLERGCARRWEHIGECM